MWLNKYPSLKDDHNLDLERRAALLEFHHGFSKEAAEHQAHKEYIEKQHLKGAAHHYVGMKKAKERGNSQDSNKHYLSYIMHLGKLGLNLNDPVSPKIMAFVDPDLDADGFVPHEADVLAGAK